MEWLKLDDVKSLKGATVKSREDLIKLTREEGAAVEDDARIAVGIGDNEITYAIEDDNGEFVFYEDGLFVPEDRDDLIADVEACLK